MSSDRYELHLGDCLDVLKAMPSDSVDSIVTDPPAGISFMGKEWDSDKGGSKQWINWMTEVMKEALRVAKPGAHALVWALPRTSHWTATACEWAGWEVRDVVMHVFGSGFPKSLDVSKAIDKELGEEREIVGYKTQGTRSMFDGGNPRPASLPASRWSGWGTALKPGAEHWLLLRKPLEERNVALNVMKHETGALNIDGSRVGMSGGTSGHSYAGTGLFGIGGKAIIEHLDKGRFPTNFVLSHSDDCLLRAEGRRAEGRRATIDFSGKERERPNAIRYDGEAKDDVDCAPDCPVAELDRQSGSTRAAPPRPPRMMNLRDFSVGEGEPRERLTGHSFGDAGGASRFFYVPKPSRHERDFGLGAEPGTTDDGRQTPIDNPYLRGETMRRNRHPTVKSYRLMRYLITMITPPGGKVLDMFAGSGTTPTVAVACGFRTVAIEKDPESFETMRARVASVRLAPQAAPVPADT